MNSTTFGPTVGPTAGSSSIAPSLQQTRDAVDTVWLLISGALVFLMQLGFVSLEAGLVNEMWVPVIITKNFQDCFLSIICFVALGYAIAFSQSMGGFVGNMEYALTMNIPDDQWKKVFFQTTFASAAITIVSGCVLERMKTVAYELLTVWVIIFQYSFVVHWVWNDNGFLMKWGFHDFAGSGVVHLTGGVIGLMMVILLGPRGESSQARAVNLPLVTTGTFIFWFGWIGFNAGSVGSLVKDNGAAIASKVAVIVLMAPATSAITTIHLLHPFIWKKVLRCMKGSISDNRYLYVRDLVLNSGVSLPDVLNSVLCGLVSVTAGCNRMEVWGGAVTGILSSFTYLGWKSLLERLKIDEPLLATGVHGACGFLGVIAVALFDNHGDPPVKQLRFLGIQLAGALIIIAWNVIGSLIFYILVSKCLRGAKVGVLSDELGLRMYRVYPSLAFATMLMGEDKTARRWLWYFYHYLRERHTEEHLEFLVAVKELKDFVLDHDKPYPDLVSHTKCLWDLYVEVGSEKQVNVSDNSRKLVKKLYGHVLAGIAPEIERDDDDDEEKTLSPRSKNIQHLSRIITARQEVSGVLDHIVSEVDTVVQGPFKEFIQSEFHDLMMFDGWNLGTNEKVYTINESSFHVEWIEGPGKWWEASSRASMEFAQLKSV